MSYEELLAMKSYELWSVMSYEELWATKSYKLRKAMSYEELWAMKSYEPWRAELSSTMSYEKL